MTDLMLLISFLLFFFILGTAFTYQYKLPQIKVHNLGTYDLGTVEISTMKFKPRNLIAEQKLAERGIKCQ